MKLQTTLLAIILCISYAQAQDGISVNTTGADPDASAILDVSSTTKGALFPRMTQTQRDAIGTPALGLTIYQTDGVAGYYNWNGSIWTKVGAFEFDGTQATFSGDKVLIGSTGNIPNSNLYIAGTDTSAVAVNSTSGGAVSAFRSISGSYGEIGTLGAYDFALMANDTEVMRVTSSGSVGIGTATPSGNLHVFDNDGNTELRVSNSPGGAAGVIRSIGGASVGFGTATSSDVAIIQNNTTGILLKAGTGNVGIGGTPDQKLSVNGNASKVGGGTWATFSDRRVKKNINTFNNGLSTLQKINPVTFQYNGLAGYEDDGKEYVGIIAQEVQPLAPYMFEKVSKKLKEEDAQKTDLWMYDSNALTYILVNSIKEQQAQIEQLKKELAQKNGEVHSLQSDKEKLEASLQSIDARLKEIENLLKQ